MRAWLERFEPVFEELERARRLFQEGQEELQVGFAVGNIQHLPRDIKIISAKLTTDGGEVMD